MLYGADIVEYVGISQLRNGNVRKINHSLCGCAMFGKYTAEDQCTIIYGIFDRKECPNDV